MGCSWVVALQYGYSNAKRIAGIFGRAPFSSIKARLPDRLFGCFALTRAVRAEQQATSRAFLDHAYRQSVVFGHLMQQIECAELGDEIVRGVEDPAALAPIADERPRYADHVRAELVYEIVKLAAQDVRRSTKRPPGIEKLAAAGV